MIGQNFLVQEMSSPQEGTTLQVAIQPRKLFHVCRNNKVAQDALNKIRVHKLLIQFIPWTFTLI